MRTTAAKKQVLLVRPCYYQKKGNNTAISAGATSIQCRGTTKVQQLPTLSSIVNTTSRKR
jgi:hypothetical protein